MRPCDADLVALGSKTLRSKTSLGLDRELALCKIRTLGVGWLASADRGSVRSLSEAKGYLPRYFSRFLFENGYVWPSLGGWFHAMRSSTGTGAYQTKARHGCLPWRSPGPERGAKGQERSRNVSWNQQFHELCTYRGLPIPAEDRAPAVPSRTA